MQVTVPKKLTKAERGGARGLPKCLARAAPASAGGQLRCPSAARYMISVAADLVGMHPADACACTRREGSCACSRTPGGTRLYSEADVERLRLVQRLTTELGLNLAGVQHVLRLEDELAGPERAMDARSERELRDEIAAVHPQAVPA